MFDPVFDVVTWCWEISFNHNPVKRDETDKAGWIVESLIPPGSQIMEQSPCQQTPGREYMAQAPAQTHRPLIGRRGRVYLLPVTPRLVAASGWLTFGR